MLVRVRPLLGEHEEQRCLQVTDERSIRVQAEREHLFSFDEVHSACWLARKLAEPLIRGELQQSALQVLGHSATQEDVYKAVVQGIKQDLCAGRNATVVAYGQTGRTAGSSVDIAYADRRLFLKVGQYTRFRQDAQPVWGPHVNGTGGNCAARRPRAR